MAGTHESGKKSAATQDKKSKGKKEASSDQKKGTERKARGRGEE